MASRDVRITIIGDASSAQRAFKATGVAASGFAKQTSAVFAGLQLDRVARSIVSFAGDSIQAFQESELAQTRLSDAFSKFPQLAGANIDALRDLNSALAEKTRFDDDATASAQAQLAQFGLTADQIAELTPLVQDLAAKTGKGLDEAATIAGKAILGQGRALKEVGIEFRDTGDAAGNFGELVGSLRSQVGGFAEKEGKTSAGQAAILANQFGELQENIGSALLPVLLKLSKILLTLVEFFRDLNPGVIAAIGVFVGLAAVVLTTIKVVGLLNAAIALFGGTTTIALGPVVLIIAAIAALVAGVIYAYQNFETFRNVVDTVIGAIVGVVSWAWGNILQPVFDAHVWYIGKVIEVLQSLAYYAGVIWNGVSSAVQAAWGVIEPIIGFIVEGVNKVIGLVGTLQDIVGSIGTSLGGGNLDELWKKIEAGELKVVDGKVVAAAEGGIFTKPTLTLLGEAGPEAVIPLSRTMPSGVNMTVNIDARGAQAGVGSEIMDAITRYVRANRVPLEVKSAFA